MEGTEGNGFTFSGIQNSTDTSVSSAPEAAAPTTSDVNNAENDTLENILGAPAETEQPESKPEEGKKTEGSEKEEADKIPAWISQLPEELKKDELFKSFDKLGDLAKAYKELAAAKNNQVEIPGEGADQDTLQAFYEKLGKPKTAEGYEIKGEGADALKQLAFSNNLTVDQARSVFGAMQKTAENYLHTQQTQLQEKYTNTNNALKSEYGNEYSKKMQLLKKGLDTYGGDNLRAKLAGSGLAYDIDIIKLFINLGQMSQEATTSLKGSATSDGYKSNREGGMFTFKAL